MIAVQNDRTVIQSNQYDKREPDKSRDWYSHTILLGHGPNVVCGGDGTGDRGLLLVVRQSFTCKIGTSSLRNLEDDGRFYISDLDISHDLVG